METQTPEAVAEWLASVGNFVDVQTLQRLKNAVVERRISGAMFSDILNSQNLGALGLDNFTMLQMNRVKRAWKADHNDGHYRNASLSPRPPMLSAQLASQPTSGLISPPSNPYEATVLASPPLPLHSAVPSNELDNLATARAAVVSSPYSPRVIPPTLDTDSRYQGPNAYPASASPWPSAPVGYILPTAAVPCLSPAPPHPYMSWPPPYNMVPCNGYTNSTFSQSAPTSAPNLTACLAMCVDRLGRWAGFDRVAALGQLRDVLPANVWDELMLMFTGQPKTTVLPVEAKISSVTAPTNSSASSSHRSRATSAIQDPMQNSAGASTRQERSPSVTFVPPQSRARAPTASQLQEPLRTRIGSMGSREPTHAIVQTAPSQNSQTTPVTIRRFSQCSQPLDTPRERIVSAYGLDERRTSIPLGSRNSVVSVVGVNSVTAPAARLSIAKPTGDLDTPSCESVAPSNSIVAPNKRIIAQSATSADSSNCERTPESVVAWIQQLPPSVLLGDMQDALVASIQGEGIDGNTFTKIVEDAGTLASHGVPSPVRAMKLRKAWAEVLREEECKRIAVESAVQKTNMPKSVKLDIK